MFPRKCDWESYGKQGGPLVGSGRAPDYESGGREFESLRARQELQLLMITIAHRLLPRNAIGKRMESNGGFFPDVSSKAEVHW